MKLNIFMLIIMFFLPLTISLNAMSTKDKPLVDERIKDFDKRVPAEHPRILILKKEIPAFRDFFNKMKDDKNSSYIFKNAIMTKFDIPLIPEPEQLPKERSAEWTKMWQKAYGDAFKAASTAQHYAFSYLITGEEKYAREAAKWLLHVSSWDVNGGINIKTNDEAFIQSFRPMILAYDWAYDGLTKEERKIIEDAIRKRMDILFPHVTKVYLAGEDIPKEKAESHKMRFISTIGLAGLGLYKELKDAPTYLAWAYEYYKNQFPVWGGKDGGYSEGLEYWTTGHNQHFMFLDSMKALELNEIFERDYFKNNGYFALYNVMPYPFSSFGDLCQTVKPNENIAMHVEKYALIYNNPYFMKFNEIIFTKYPTGVNYYTYSLFDSIFQLYRKGNAKVQSKELSDLPRSRAFYDVGWVSMHSNLGSKTDDIALGFKSSPYGSISHSFADQNSFIINAFGEQLAQSTGYREWYGSPHHYGYSKTTFSQNAVLFGGKSQMINNANANGKITNFYTGKNFDFTSGDATDAFDKKIGVTKNLRSVFFVNKKYFIMLDEVGSEESYSHQWLLHAKSKMSESPEKNEVIITNNNANLLVKFLIPEKKDLRFSQTDEFVVPVDNAYKSKMVKQWHFTAETEKPVKSETFLTILYPYKKDNYELTESKQIKSKSGFIVECKTKESVETIFISGSAKKTENIENVLDGSSGVISKSKDKTLFAFIDSSIFKNKEITIFSDKIISGEGEFDKSKMTVELKIKEKTEVKIKLSSVPKNVTGVEKDRWKYDEKTSMLNLNVDKDSLLIITF